MPPHRPTSTLAFSSLYTPIITAFSILCIGVSASSVLHNPGFSTSFSPPAPHFSPPPTSSLSPSTRSSLSIPPGSSRPPPSAPSRPLSPLGPVSPAVGSSSARPGAQKRSSVRGRARFGTLSTRNRTFPPLSLALSNFLPCEDVLLHVEPLSTQLSARWSTLSADARWKLKVSIASSVVKKTLKDYGRAVRAFLGWCERNNIPPAQRLPIPETVLLRYLADNLEDIRASTYTTRRSALALWHSIHGYDFSVDSIISKRIGRAARLLQPEAVPSRPPVRLDDLYVIRNALPIERDRASAAIWACLYFAFFALARLGELTVDVLSAPGDPRDRSSRCHWSLRSREGSVAPTAILRLPTEKVQGPNGVDLIAAEQRTSPSICPVAAVRWHLHVNSEVPPHAGAFAFIDKDGLVHELRTQFCVDTANAALTAARRAPITAHCLRIGGTTFYMAAGISEADIRRHGRWKSDAMLVYLRRLYVAAGRAFADVDPTHG